MRLHRILDDLVFAERGYLNGNQLLALGGEPALVDTGYAACWPATERVLAAAGLAVEEVRLVVNTHCHCDHVGGNGRIQARSGCGVALHSVGRRHVETGNDRATWTGYFELDADAYLPTVSLEDGATVLLGRHRFTVHHTPGHSADSIVLHQPEHGILVAGDTLWEGDVGLVNPFVEGPDALADHLASLERIEGLEVRWVLPGHGRPFQDFAGAVAEARRRIRRFLDDPAAQGTALLRKMFVFKLLIDPGLHEAEFERRITGAPWYLEAVELAGGDPAATFRATVDDLVRKGACERRDGRLVPTART